jgi:hypothetical protein
VPAEGGMADVGEAAVPVGARPRLAQLTTAVPDLPVLAGVLQQEVPGQPRVYGERQSTAAVISGDIAAIGPARTVKEENTYTQLLWPPSTASSAHGAPTLTVMRALSLVTETNNSNNHTNTP